jgi:hypothetical protein
MYKQDLLKRERRESELERVMLQTSLGPASQPDQSHIGGRIWLTPHPYVGMTKFIYLFFPLS